MMRLVLYSLLGSICCMLACAPHAPQLSINRSKEAIPPGTAFYSAAAGLTGLQRDSMALQWVQAGYVPTFFRQLKAVQLQRLDSASRQRIRVVMYVSPDYLVLGNDTDWVRVPLSAMAAQVLAKNLGALLPTTNMVDAIYEAARVKLAPVPMLAFRDSAITFYHHHLIVEGQRQGRKGLIAGIKKDIVVTDRLRTSTKPNRLAIYGWHKTDGNPIQPLYTGHVDWYTDYSHGVRLVSRRMRVGKKWLDAQELIGLPQYRSLLTADSVVQWYPYRSLYPD